MAIMEIVIYIDKLLKFCICDVLYETPLYNNYLKVYILRVSTINSEKIKITD